MKNFCKYLLFGVCLSLSVSCNRSSVELGKLQNGAAVSFVRSGGEYGIEITGGIIPILAQKKPAQIEVWLGDNNIRQLTSGYRSVKLENNTAIAKASVKGNGKAAFEVEDKWSVSGDIISLNRKVTVTSPEDSAGFLSAIRLSTDSTIKWEDAEYFAPGLLYSDPTYDGDNSPGGTLNYKAKLFTIREDNMSAPLFGLSFKKGNWVAVLDLDPNGETISTESSTPTAKALIDEHLLFGAFGVQEVSGSGVELGFWLPGSTQEFSGGFGPRTTAAPSQVVRRRYNPVTKGFSHTYQVGFRIGKGESFLNMERDAWRWAWESLKPKVNPIDLDMARRAMLDHLADHVLIVGNMAGVPFLYDAVSGRPGSYRSMTMRLPIAQTAAAAPVGQANRPATLIPARNEMTPEKNVALAKWAKKYGVDLDPNARELELWPKITMGFVSKGIEAADQLVQEGDRDSGTRGQKMRKLGLMIIDTYIRMVPMNPPSGEGFNLWTASPDCQASGTVMLRSPSEDMRSLLDGYRREKNLGREHPEWLRWCRSFGDFLVKNQREDGSWPRSWTAGTGAQKEVSGTGSYNPIPMLVKLTKETGDKKYQEAAIKAADFVWTAFGNKGVFVGGANDNPNITDKEAGMLSLNAFLSLYEATNDTKWLDMAQAAGNYTESWIWIWNVPMPTGANDSTLQWKRGVPTVGLQGITARVSGGVDEYLDWGTPDFVKLYKYTKDEHYLDVARILLHNTKAMLAIPGRTYDLKGPGWQQENWSMGLRRGYGSHRSWLPWVSVNHLHSISGIEEIDKDLYKQLAGGK
jgi:hypothetical protein